MEDRGQRKLTLLFALSSRSEKPWMGRRIFMLRKMLLGVFAIVLLVGAVGNQLASAAGFYRYNGQSFSTLAPVPQNTGLGTYFNFLNNEDVDTYGLPANLLFGAWFSTYVARALFTAPAAVKLPKRLTAVTCG